MGACSCGENLREGALFCPKCGTKAEKIKYCAMCGQINPAHFDDVCPSCIQKPKIDDATTEDEESGRGSQDFKSQEESGESIKFSVKRGLVFIGAVLAVLIAASVFIPRGGPVEVIFVNRALSSNPIIGNVEVEVSSPDWKSSLIFFNKDIELAQSLNNSGWVSQDDLQLNFVSSFSQDETFALVISPELMGSSLLDAGSTLKIFVVMNETEVTFSVWSYQLGQFGKRLEVSHPRGNEKLAVSERVEQLAVCRGYWQAEFNSQIRNFLRFEEDYLAAVEDANLMTWHNSETVWLYYSTWASRMKKLVASLDDLEFVLTANMLLVDMDLKGEALGMLYVVRDLRAAWEGMRQDARAEREWTSDDEMFDAYDEVGTRISSLKASATNVANERCQDSYPEID